METFRIETTISPNRVITVRGVPFRPGQKVEVIIVAQPQAPRKNGRYPLRGKPIRYVQPFDSVAENEWQVLR